MQWREVQKSCKLESFILWLHLERLNYGIYICCFTFAQVKTGHNRR